MVYVSEETAPDKTDARDDDEENAEEKTGLITFQYKHKPAWQIRTELPLPPVWLIWVFCAIIV